MTDDSTPDNRLRLPGDQIVTLPELSIALASQEPSPDLPLLFMTLIDTVSEMHGDAAARDVTKELHDLLSELLTDYDTLNVSQKGGSQNGHSH